MPRWWGKDMRIRIEFAGWGPMNSTVVTVVIPTFGRLQRLVECLEALGRRKFAGPWEISVVDDGSPEPV